MEMPAINSVVGGVGRFDERHFFGDHDALGHLTDFHFRVDGDDLLGGDHHAFLLEPLEAWRFDGHGVGRGFDGIEDELAGWVGESGSRDCGPLIGEGNFRDADYSAAGIHHDSANTALIGLPPREDGG